RITRELSQAGLHHGRRRAADDAAVVEHDGPDRRGAVRALGRRVLRGSRSGRAGREREARRACDEQVPPGSPERHRLCNGSAPRAVARKEPPQSTGTTSAARRAGAVPAGRSRQNATPTAGATALIVSAVRRLIASATAPRTTAATPPMPIASPTEIPEAIPMCRGR